MTIDPVRAVSADDVSQAFDELQTLFLSARTLEAYGEGLSVRDHMLQAAALAVAADAPDALVVAALLHDLGWALSAGPHETAAADRLEPLFGPAVAEPIRLHVSAKRYLVATEPGYVQHLSDASRQTLTIQGGAFEAEACKRFEGDPAFRAALGLRRFDDDAKVVGLVTPGFSAYERRIRRLLEAARGRPAVKGETPTSDHGL